jgi:cobalt-zinc-cadmium efflux system membrane fusion protein
MIMHSMNRIIGFLALAATNFVQPLMAAEESGRLTIEMGEIEKLDIVYGTATAATEYLLATLPAVIMPPPNARVAVAATFPGTVMRILAVEGEAVKRGQTLAIISSRDVLAETSELAQARARLAVAKSAAERMSRLATEGIIAGGRADEAAAELAQAQAEVDSKARILNAIGAVDAEGTYRLMSPIDGVVASAKIQTGAAVDVMAAPYVVDATDSYEVTAQVPERLIGKITPGMTVQVGEVRATVTSVGAVIQPDTRSASLKAAVTPGSGVVSGRTGMASIFAPAPKAAVVIPKAAVTDLQGKSVVFVQNGKALSVRTITAAGIAGDTVVALSGLRPGEKVAVTGLSILKSMILSK